MSLDSLDCPSQLVWSLAWEDGWQGAGGWGVRGVAALKGQAQDSYQKVPLDWSFPFPEQPHEVAGVGLQGRRGHEAQAFAQGHTASE